jgi:hypothetical protein
LRKGRERKEKEDKRRYKMTKNKEVKKYWKRKDNT